MDNNQTPAPQTQGNSAAIVALCCGIASLIFWLLFPPIGLILGIVGIVFGVKGRKNPDKKGMATAGMVCGIIGVVLCAIGSICFICACMAGEAVNSAIASLS